MVSLFARSARRRAERASATRPGTINLVPLVDILTSIVFFSMLTYSGAATALTAFDASAPLVPGGQAGAAAAPTAVAVRLGGGRLTVSAGDSTVVVAERDALGAASLGRLESVLRDLRRRTTADANVTVIPADDVSYDAVVRVLERVRLADFRAVSLGVFARKG